MGRFEDCLITVLIVPSLVHVMPLGGRLGCRRTGPRRRIRRWPTREHRRCSCVAGLHGWAVSVASRRAATAHAPAEPAEVPSQSAVHAPDGDDRITICSTDEEIGKVHHEGQGNTLAQQKPQPQKPVGDWAFALVDIINVSQLTGGGGELVPLAAAALGSKAGSKYDRACGSRPDPARVGAGGRVSFSLHKGRTPAFSAGRSLTPTTRAAFPPTAPGEPAVT